MSTIEIVAIAIALAMDAFAVSVATGMALRRVSGAQTLRLSCCFGGFQALMPIIGWVAGLTIQKLIASFDHWVAFALLATIGIRMIVGGLGDQEETRAGTDPTRGWTVLILSLATSIDALAVGLSLAMLRLSVWIPSLVIGIVAAAFTIAGLRLGSYVGTRVPIARYAAVAGGIILILIGIRILHEHGVI